ncbi:major facilitator superfamily domain-containing protein [Xylariomycetidae sp. FL0641]|nr:major facilitator superfamily domain-containing protein [Xylariomycetidae sp. FL0641]
MHRTDEDDVPHSDVERLPDHEPRNADPPDGGLKAWTQTFCMHLVCFNTWGVANGYGIFQQYYIQAFDKSQFDVSWIGSVQVFLLFFVGVFTGRLTDAGHFVKVFFAGVFLQLLGLFMASLADTYWQILLAQAVCLGLGNGCTFCPALAVLSQYFKKNRAFSVGVAAAGAAVGGLVYPLLIDQLLNHRQIGLHWTLRIMGFVMLGTYVPCLVWLRPRLPPRTTGPWVDTTAFKELPFLFFAMSMFLNFWGLYFAFFYLGTFASDILGVSSTTFLLIILNAVGIAGRIIPNLVADRCTGVLNTLIVISFSASILVYCWAAIDSTAGLVVFTVIYGLLAAALQALFPAAATTMTPEANRTGTRVGMILGFVSFANLTGPAICGVLINSDGGSYLGAQMFAGSSIFLGAIMATAARVAKTGWVLRVRV